MNRIASHKLSAVVQRGFLAVLVAMVLLGTGPVNTARAWAIGTQNGRPGSMTLPNIYIGDLFMPWGSRQFTLYGSTGPMVSRSPASTGAQNVVGLYVVEKWNGSAWVTSAKAGPFSGTIASTQTRIQFPAPYIQPIAARGYFRVSYIFTWKTTSGVSLGGAAVVSNVRADHICVTPYRLCQSFDGYFRTGLSTTTW